MKIDSCDDPRLEPYRNLRHRDPRGNCRMIAEGRLIVERLLHSRHDCESLLVEKNHHLDLIAAAKEAYPETVVFEADGATLRELVGYDFHRGVLACAPRPCLSALELLSRPGDAAAPLLVVCGVTDPENMGGLMRTAASFGVQQVALTDDCADPFSRRALRVSMAAVLRLECYRMRHAVADLRWLSTELGYRSVASTLSADSTSIDQFRRDERPLAILVGSEGEGLPPAVQRAADDRVTIPMHRGSDSLNVNVATAILLYELTRT